MWTLTLTLAALTATCLMLAGMPLVGTALLVSAAGSAAVEMAAGDDDE